MKSIFLLGSLFHRGERRTKPSRLRRPPPRGEHLERRLALSVSTDDELTSLGRSEDYGHPQTSTCGCAGCALPRPEVVEMWSTEAPPEAIFPLDKTFTLSSRPSATKVIYLDFDGHTTTGTAWAGGGTFVTPAYTIDASSSFTNTELLNIQNIWARTAEAFSPFNVNVTTARPSLDDLRQSGSGDQRWGIRVVVGGDGAWYGPFGGVAYVGSFSWSSDTPTFVFSENLGSPKSIADAAIHEVGHTLGLSHDGRVTPKEGYYEGHGSGPTGWAPIMGVGYYRQLVQWSRGEYASANNREDDLAIITGEVTTRYTPNGNGFGYRPDDHGNTLATARQYVGSKITGVIERNTDVDAFRFQASGRTVIDIRPSAHAPMLDIRAELVNASGTVVTTSNPSDNVHASFDLTLATGTYYLRIRGAGKGNPLDTGYTNYGSLGQYTLSIKGNAPPGKVQSITATPGKGEVRLAWNTPSSNGGSAITDYVIQLSGDAGKTWRTFTDGVSTRTAATVTGLTNGTRYVFRVAAVNALGRGSFVTSKTVTPRTVPNQPVIVSATPSNRQVRLTWNAPPSNGGAAITDYLIQYSSNNGRTWRTFKDGVSTTRAVTVTGLTNGTRYVFRVAAVNVAGTGAFSARSGSVTPRRA
jgi:hypothetical protein